MILSSGFTELIEPVLEREGISLEVHANRLDTRAGNWRPIWRDDAQCAECGEACKRAGLPDSPVVYVGDGYSDRCVALAADRIYARDGLVDYLRVEGRAVRALRGLRSARGVAAREPLREERLDDRVGAIVALRDELAARAVRRAPSARSSPEAGGAAAGSPRCRDAPARRRAR